MAQNVHFRHEAKEEHNRNRGQNQPHLAIIFLLFWRSHHIYLSMQAAIYRFIDFFRSSDYFIASRVELGWNFKRMERRWRSNLPLQTFRAFAIRVGPRVV
jgi:hypothetical protein